MSFLVVWKLSQKNFAGVQIYRPRYSTQSKILIESESHLRSKFHPGVYKNSQEINQIIFHQFDYYYKKFNEIIPQLASRDLIKFILYEYDKTSEIDEIYKNRKLNQQQIAKWRELGPKLRRSAKYLCERVVLLQPEERPNCSAKLFLGLLDEIWIAAEEMVKLYIASDQTIGHIFYS